MRSITEIRTTLQRVTLTPKFEKDPMKAMQIRGFIAGLRYVLGVSGPDNNSESMLTAKELHEINRMLQKLIEN